MKNKTQLIDDFKKVKDNLGKSVDEGVIVCVYYLNKLGFPTTQSCEGHVRQHGYPFAWVEICSDVENSIKNDKESATFIAENETRNKLKELEKTVNFKFDAFEKKYGDWIKIYNEKLKEHQLYKEYQDEKRKMEEAFSGTKEKARDLVIEFCHFSNIETSELSFQKASSRIRINFCSDEIRDKYNQKGTKASFVNYNRTEIKKNSDGLVSQFEIFLQNKYEKTSF